MIIQIIPPPRPYDPEEKRDPRTLLPVRGMIEYDNLVRFWFSVGRAKMLEPTRADWQNYLVSMGLTAIRACKALGLLVSSGVGEGAQCVARQVLEIMTRFVYVLEEGEAVYTWEFARDQRQVAEIKRRAGAHDWTWLREFSGVGTAPNTPAASPRDVGVGLGMEAEYAYLCLSTHNHATALRSKYGQHWDEFPRPTNPLQIYSSFHNEQRDILGPTLDPFVPMPSYELERYLHIVVDAMAKGIIKLADTPEMWAMTEEDRSALKQKQQLFVEHFKRACPVR